MKPYRLLPVAAFLLALSVTACRPAAPPAQPTPAWGRSATAGAVPLPSSPTPASSTAGPTASRAPEATRTPAGAAESPQPTLRPGQARLAYSLVREGNQDIYIQFQEGVPPQRLTDSPDPERYPAWSPDGERIAYVRQVDGRAAIFVMRADGTGQTRLTADDGGKSSMPTWSPDGRQIAYTHTTPDDPDHPRIYVMHADGSDPRPLTPAGTLAAQPAWSPDGRRIAHLRCEGETCGICLMDGDGSNVVRLTWAEAGDQWPAWSRDGSRLLLCRVREGQGGILLINADGTGERMVVREDRARHPTWLGNRGFFYTVAADDRAWLCASDVNTVAEACAGGEPGVYELDPACWWILPG